MAALSAEWLTEPAELAALGGEWDALLPADARPFDLHCWYTAWWEAFGSAGGMRVCAVRREGRLAGVLPLYREGRELRAMANGHSPVFRPLAIDAEAGAALLAAAGAEDAARLELPSLPAGDPCLEPLGVAANGMHW